MKNKLTLVLFFCLFTLHISAQGFIINQYDIDIKVSSEGYFDVTENISVDFTEKKRGIFRNIPYKYKIDGKNLKLDIEKIYVQNWKFTDYKENNNIVIRIGDKNKYITGRQDYKISYRVYDAFLRFDDYMEFNWNLIGTGWEAKMENVRFRITFPDNVVLENNDVLVYAGKERTQQQYINYSASARSVSGESSMGLFAKEGLTVAVRLEPGVINYSSKNKSVSSNSRTVAKEPKKDYTYPIPILLGFILFGFWKKAGSNNKRDENVVEQFYPPQDISSAEVGTFYDNNVNTRDIISLIAEWGRKEYIVVRSPGEEYGYQSDDLLIEKTDILRNSEPEYQKIMFAEIFSEGDSILLSSLKNNFYRTFSKVKSALKREVRKFGLYDESSYNIFHSGWFVGLFFLAIGGGIASFIFGQTYTGLALIALGIFCLIIHFLPPRHNENGQFLKDYLKGFKLFLENPDDKKLSELCKKDSKYFEKVLPFAIALGLDKKLTDKFNSLQEYAPSWYYYGESYSTMNRGSFANFSENFNVKTVSSAFTSSPQSSGSSSGSFSGGGSVGGGFGGGGGGSW